MESRRSSGSQDTCCHDLDLTFTWVGKSCFLVAQVSTNPKMLLDILGGEGRVLILVFCTCHCSTYPRCRESAFNGEKTPSFCGSVQGASAQQPPLFSVLFLTVIMQLGRDSRRNKEKEILCRFFSLTTCFHLLGGLL